MNVVEDVTTVDKKEEIKRIGKLVDELGGTATQVPKKVIKKIGKLVPEDKKTASGTKVQDSGERFAINKPKTIVSIESNPELDARILSSAKNKYDVIREYLIEVYGGRTFELSDGRRAIMDKSDAKELSHKADKKRTAQLGNLDEIISKAKYDHSAYNVKHNKFIDFHYYEITVKYNGEEFDLWINVGKGKYDGLNHIYSITNKKEDASTNYGVGGPVGNHLQNASSNSSISQNVENSNSSNKKSAKEFKQSQFDIIQKTNPMWDEYHTGIRSVEDIRTWDEVLKLDDESEGQFFWGDFSRADAEQALKNGKITVYSSYPIKNGVFVSTSYVQAEEYAGGRGGKVYSKTVPLTDVAWINGDEGQFAAVDTSAKTVDSGERFALADGKRATAGEVAAVKSSISKRGIDPKGIIAIADKYFARYSGQLTRTGVRYEFLAAADMLFDLTAESGDRAYASVEALAEELVTNEKDKKPPIVSLYYKRSFLFDCGF